MLRKLKIVSPPTQIIPFICMNIYFIKFVFLVLFQSNEGLQYKALQSNLNKLILIIGWCHNFKSHTKATGGRTI